MSFWAVHSLQNCMRRGEEEIEIRTETKPYPKCDPHVGKLLESSVQNKYSNIRLAKCNTHLTKNKKIMLCNIKAVNLEKLNDKMDFYDCSFIHSRQTRAWQKACSLWSAVGCCQSYLVCAGDAAGKCDGGIPDRAALHRHLSTNTGPRTLQRPLPFSKQNIRQTLLSVALQHIE